MPPPDPPDDRRQSRRLPLSADVMLSLLVPEQTISATPVRGVAMDISETGMRLKSYQVSPEQAELVADGSHWAKVTIELPYLARPLELKSRIVRSQYLRRTPEDSAHCVLGLRFERLLDSETAQIHYVIDRLSGESYEAVPIKGIRLSRKP